MKNLFLVFFMAILTMSAFAQSQQKAAKVVFDGTEFTTMSPEQNATAYSNYLATTYKLDANQKQKVHDIRLKSAKHYQILAAAGSNAELNQKKERVISYDYGLVLRSLDPIQKNAYKVAVENREFQAVRAQGAGKLLPSQF